MSIKAVIFDLDGTITRPFFNFDAIRKEMGLDNQAGPVWEVMEQMSPQRRKAAEDILHFHEQKAVEESTLNTGVSRTLEKLRDAGIAVAILTRNRKCNVLAVAQKHGLEFDMVIGREEGPVKPDAFGVLEISQQFGVEPAETMVVGDYLYDLLCAKAAGASAVLLANHERAEEFAEHADFVIENISDILEIIEHNKN